MANISFREYLESIGKPMSAPLFLKGEAKAQDFDAEKIHYIKTGGNDHMLAASTDKEIIEQLSILWESKMINIKPQLFKSEYALFDEFLKHLALGVGDLFKADKLAKLLGSSRRKVYKYMEILENE
jgi:predicted AAA+ superfamily ATPase